MVEEGDHATLLARKGAYWRLYEAQAKGSAAQVAALEGREERE